MTLPASVEGVIEVASRLKDGVAGLYEAHGLLPAVLEKEHRAIRSGDFTQVEAVRHEKEAVCDRVESCFSALMHAGDRLGALRAAMTGVQAPRPVTLTECVAALAAICAEIPAAELGGQVLRHLLAGLRPLVDLALARHREVQPLIEANRHLVTLMLDNYRESYRFWLEVQEKEALGYNPQGVQQAAGRNSGFRIKA